MPHRKMELAEVARHLHMEPAQIEALVRQADIPCETSCGRPLFSRQAIDAWASQRILGMSERRLADYHRDSSRNTRQSDGQHPAIARLLSPEGTIHGLPARTRAAVLHELTAVADRHGVLYDAKDLLRSLEEREALCSTAMAGGVALLHPRHHDPFLASESFLLLARSQQTIHFGAPDGAPTDLFFLLVCQDDLLHLHALARLCTMIHTTPLLSALRDVETAAAMYAAVVAAECEVLARLSR